MAESDVTVRFTADSDVGRVLSQLRSQSAQTVRSMQQIGAAASSAGRTLSIAFTAPVALIAGASTKLAVTFDKEMTKINTLVGVAAEQVNAWRQSILDLAPAVGQTPAELARGLFVVTSAGERTGTALEILEQAAKASAVGLGDTADIARTVTAALQAYGKANLSAAKATDVLVATVREGNLVAEELSGSLGRVLPLAAKLGVTFDQVGAFVATFTRLGVDASEATTALRGALNVFLGSGKQAALELERVGLSAALLRSELRDKGLVQALNTLVTAFEGDDEALRRVVPRIRALTGVLAVAVTQAESFEEISRKIAGSLGILDEAFKIVLATPAFKLEQLKVKIVSVGIALGQTLLPTLDRVVTTFSEALRVIAKIVDVFAGLPEFVQKTIIVFNGLVAVIGPLLLIVGQLAIGFSALGTLLAGLVGTGGALAALVTFLGPGGLIAAGIAALIGLSAGIALFLNKVDVGSKAAATSLDVMTDALRRQDKALKDFNLDQRVGRFVQLGLQLAKVEQELIRLRAALPPPPGPSIGRQLRLGERLERAGLGVRIVETEELQRIRELEGQLEILRASLEKTGDAVRDAAAQARAESKATAEAAAAAMTKIGTELENMLRRIDAELRLGLTDAEAAAAEKASALRDAIAALLDEGVDPASDRIAGMARQVRVLEAEMAGATVTTNEMIGANNVAVQGATKVGLAFKEAAEQVAEFVFQTGQAANILGPAPVQPGAGPTTDDQAATVGEAFVRGVVDAIERSSDVISAGLVSLFQAATEGSEADIKAAAEGLARSFVRGIIDGHLSLKSFLKSFIKAFFEIAVIKVVSRLFGAFSPSRVFVRFGRDVVRGLIVGMDDMSRPLVARTEQLASSVTTAFAAAQRDDLLRMQPVSVRDSLATLSADLFGAATRPFRVPELPRLAGDQVDGAGLEINAQLVPATPGGELDALFQRFLSDQQLRLRFQGFR